MTISRQSLGARKAQRQGKAPRIVLPGRALFDTTALIPALGGRVRTDEDRASRELFNAMIGEPGQVVLIASPSLAELCRGDPNVPIPRTEAVRVVALDRLAAYMLGTKFPPHVLTQYAEGKKGKKPYIKYDAMIVACAMRWKADKIISRDDDVRKLARHAGIESSTAVDAMKNQNLSLFTAAAIHGVERPHGSKPGRSGLVSSDATSLPQPPERPQGSKLARPSPPK